MEIFTTDTYDRWFRRLKDQRARARSNLALRRCQIEEQMVGDLTPVGDQVYEMHFHFGPGYRVYYLRQGSTLVLLPAGGDKSTQSDDIASAKALATEHREEQQWPWPSIAGMPASTSRLSRTSSSISTRQLAVATPRCCRRRLVTWPKPKGMAEVARAAGVGRESLYKSLSATGNPSFQTVAKVIEALGGQLTVAPKAASAH